jgi:hypothetical protein
MASQAIETWNPRLEMAPPKNDGGTAACPAPCGGWKAAGTERLVAHELELVDVDQAHVGDLEVRDHRERQEGDLQERLGERHA